MTSTRQAAIERRIAGLLVVGLTLSLQAQTQLQMTDLPQFDVASVKANRLGEQPSNNWKLTPTRTDFHNSQVMQLLKSAWGDFSMRVEGAPDWTLSERYDVVGQYQPDTPAATRTLMLRALLLDRFKLAAHIEMREAAMYALVVATPGGALGRGLQPGMPACAPPWAGRSQPPPECGKGVSGRGFIDFGSYDMTMLARILSGFPAVGRPVIDKTGLAGNYKVALTFAPPAPPPQGAAGANPDSAPVVSDGPSIFTALEEQLGLKLESTRGQVPVLVVDHIERPTPD